MRVIAISGWLTCEAMALHSPKREGREHVAAWVGTYAHALIADVKTPFTPTPGRMTFDRITPTFHAAAVQAHDIAVVARRLMFDEGWGVVATEETVYGENLTGHLDVRAWHKDFGEAIIDLKTGALPSTAWVQVGGYIDLSISPVDWGGVLHVPRVAINKDVTGTLEFRDGDDLRAVWNVNMGADSGSHGRSTPNGFPGLHCKRCNVSGCAARMGSGNG